LKVEALGAGEILLTSIDCEGTGKGFDIDLTARIADSVSIPVIACGGAGNSSDILNVIEKGHADAVSMASILHYNYIRQFYSQDDFSSEGNIEFLRSGRGFSKVQETALPEIKQHAMKNGIFCRLMNGD